jgi:hypothetical protein
MRLDSVVGAQGNKPPISGLTGCGAAALQRFTHELHTGWQRCPLILTRSVSEASGAIASLTLRVSMVAVAIVVYATHE